MLSEAERSTSSPPSASRRTTPRRGFDCVSGSDVSPRPRMAAGTSCA